LPYLQVASLEFVEKQPPETLVGALHGQPADHGSGGMVLYRARILD